MQFLCYAIGLALLRPHALAASDDKSKTEEPTKPCTIRSPNSGSFFDLNPIYVPPPKTGKKPTEDERLESWHARGYDYGTNFTLNFCGAVIEKLQDVVGVEEKLWRNVSAFYRMEGKIFSIGQQNEEPVFRGRKLVLNYTNGSPCSPRSSRRALLPRMTGNSNAQKLKGDDDDDDDDGDSDKKEKPKDPKNGKSNDEDDEKKPGSRPDDKRRKSTIISLLCERDPLAAKAAVSFVGASEDECTYFFEARSSAACPSVNAEKQQLGPSGVFGVIATVAILVYVIGGVVYQRVVMHQRGLRQLPNYAIWAGMGGFVRDMFIILTSSCTRFLPSRRGYSRVAANGRPPRRGSGGSDDENRLIDQLDEEWED